MIKLYITDIDFLEEEPIFLNYLQKASEERKKKIEGLKQREDQKRSLAAELLLHHALKEVGTGKESVIYKENQKPQLENSTRYFNLSHSGRYVVCAIAEEEIGIDIQKVEIKTAVTQIAKRFFLEEEFLEIIAKKKEEQADAFASLWSMKESYLKYTGVGISQGLDGILLSLRKSEFKDNCGETVFIRRYEKENYKIAVCTKGDDEVMLEGVSFS